MKKKLRKSIRASSKTGTSPLFFLKYTMACINRLIVNGVLYIDFVVRRLVKHYSHGICKSDSLYLYKLNGAKTKLFPKPRTTSEKCMWWTGLCNRSQDQLDINKITKYTYMYGTPSPSYLVNFTLWCYDDELTELFKNIGPKKQEKNWDITNLSGTTSLLNSSKIYVTLK